MVLPTAQDAHDVPPGAIARLGTTRLAGALVGWLDDDRVVISGDTLSVWSARAEPIRALAVPDRDIVVVSAARGIAVVAGLDQIRTIDLTTGATGAATTLGEGTLLSQLLMSPDGASFLSIAYQERCVRRWSLDALAPGDRVCLDAGELHGGLVLAPGDRVALVGDRAVEIRSLADGARLVTLPTEGYADGLAADATGQRLAVSVDRQVHVVATATGRAVAVLPVTVPVRHLALSPDGARVAVVEDRGVRMLEVATGRTLWSRAEPHMTDVAVAFAPGGARLAVQIGRVVQILDPVTGADVTGVRGFVTVDRAALAPDGRRAALVVDEESRVVVFDSETGTPIAAADLPPQTGYANLPSAVHALGFDTTGDAIVVAQEQGVVRIDVRAGRATLAARPRRALVYAADVSADAGQVALVEGDLAAAFELVVLDVATGRERSRTPLSMGPSADIAVALSADAALVAVVSNTDRGTGDAPGDFTRVRMIDAARGGIVADANIEARAAEAPPFWLAGGRLVLAAERGLILLDEHAREVAETEREYIAAIDASKQAALIMALEGAEPADRRVRHARWPRTRADSPPLIEAAPLTFGEWAPVAALARDRMLFCRGPSCVVWPAPAP